MQRLGDARLVGEADLRAAAFRDVAEDQDHAADHPPVVFQGRGAVLDREGRAVASDQDGQALAADDRPLADDLRDRHLGGVQRVGVERAEHRAERPAGRLGRGPAGERLDAGERRPHPLPLGALALLGAAAVGHFEFEPLVAHPRHVGVEDERHADRKVQARADRQAEGRLAAPGRREDAEVEERAQEQREERRPEAGENGGEQRRQQEERPRRAGAERAR